MSFYLEKTFLQKQYMHVDKDVLRLLNMIWVICFKCLHIISVW